MSLPRLNVVLKSPVIPWNTGNIGRTCLGFNAALHLIKPLGFDASDKSAKRAGLDYWPDVNLHIHEDWESFEKNILGPILNYNGFLFSKQEKHGEVQLDKVDFFHKSNQKVALIFGSEQKGLDGISEHSLSRLPRVYFPMNSTAIRSYNLSSSVAMGISEAWRQQQQQQQKRYMSVYSQWRPPTSSTFCDIKSLPFNLRKSYVKVHFDSNMLKVAEGESSFPFFFRKLSASIATTIFGFTHSDAASLFGTSRMFALSSSVAKALIYPSDVVNVQTIPKLLDVGAASGHTTKELLPFFDFVVATEASVVCKRELDKVVDVALATKTLEEAKQYGPFDIVALLNVLDRTEQPQQLLTDSMLLLKKGDQETVGRLLLAFSQPISYFVQPQTFPTPKNASNENDTTEKSKHDVCGNSGNSIFFDNVNSKSSFETFVEDIYEHILTPSKLKIVRWTKYPYVAGSKDEGYSYLNQVIFYVEQQ